MHQVLVIEKTCAQLRYFCPLHPSPVKNEVLRRWPRRANPIGMVEQQQIVYPNNFSINSTWYDLSFIIQYRITFINSSCVLQKVILCSLISITPSPPQTPFHLTKPQPPPRPLCWWFPWPWNRVYWINFVLWKDMFDPSVFDIRMVMGVLLCVALVAYAIFRLFVRKWGRRSWNWIWSWSWSWSWYCNTFFGML